MKPTYYAREPHFIDHLLPIWKITGGDFYCGIDVMPYAESLGLKPILGKPGEGLAVVAGFGDLRRVPYLDAVLVEHGAGQTYSSDHGSYAGGHGRDNVVLFIVPNRTVAERNRAVYPQARHAVVGCPKLDPWHPPKKTPTVGTVAISFHWNARVAPEALSAWNHYRGCLKALKKNFDNILGHAHPRMMPTMKRRYEEVGIEVVKDFSEVLDRASVYVTDNSSTLYEFASLDRPVVVLNAPWYRPEVDHGLRFWEFADVGVQVEGPWALNKAIELALADPPAIAKRRREIVPQVYEFVDGKAAERAAQAILNL